MTSDAHISRTSVAPSEDESQVLAQQIRGRKWWQGCIIEDKELRAMVSAPVHLPQGFDYWVLASQTCNLFSYDFKNIRYVEWVGAKKLETKKDSRYFTGANPRVLQSLATSSDEGEQILIECDIQVRYWMERKLLAQLSPADVGLRDIPSAIKDRTKQEKDKFAGWLARSYTRIELSDELNEALKHAKINKVFDAIAKKHGSDIYGIFLELTPSTANKNEEMLAFFNPSDVVPPCSIQVTVVVHNQATQSAVKDFLLAKFNELVEVEGSLKQAKRELAKEKDLTITGDSFEVVSTTKWNVEKLLQTVRFSFLDYFSSSVESTGS